MQLSDLFGSYDKPCEQMGFPVLTVTEKEDSIHVRQDRFLETGPAKEEDNQTIWCVHLLFSQSFVGRTNIPQANSFEPCYSARGWQA